jgi:hypothetical protein
MKFLYSRYLMLFMALSFLILPGCNSRKNNKAGQDILGKWAIYDATRNGRATKTLKDGYLSFDAENTLETNILGDVTRSNYQYNGDQLVSSQPFEYDFTVVSISKDSLHINGKMRAFSMDFYMIRYSDSLHMMHDQMLIDTIAVN